MIIPNLWDKPPWDSDWWGDGSGSWVGPLGFTEVLSLWAPGKSHRPRSQSPVSVAIQGGTAVSLVGAVVVGAEMCVVFCGASAAVTGSWWLDCRMGSQTIRFWIISKSPRHSAVRSLPRRSEVWPARVSESDRMGLRFHCSFQRLAMPIAWVMAEWLLFDCAYPCFSNRVPLPS